MARRRRIQPTLVAALTSARTRTLRRGAAEVARRLRGAPHRVRLFHQVDDPYAHLLAQVLEPFVRRYDVVLEPWLVGPPPDEAAPERARLEAFARRDAADVAPSLGLRFPEDAAAPDPARVEQATRLLAGSDAADFPSLAPRVGEALWAGDDAALEALGHETEPTPPEAARRAVAEGDALRRRLGHYLGAMLHYGGEWYWGVDRLEHLERRLQDLGALRPGADRRPLVPRPDFRDAPTPVAPASDGRVVLECFVSLRSPYTAIAMERIRALPVRFPVELVMRPVLPMVMRGLPVPREKRLYILLDTKREAARAGVPFGRVCDPVGRPVERAFTLYPFAFSRGRDAAFLHAFTHAAFAEGVDTGTDAGLRHVVERAGLAWDEARDHLDRDDFGPELERNRRELLDLGLWGVPSFRLRGPAGEPDYATWGQDRLFRVEAEIRRRVGSDAPQG
ncbi:MAG: DsbA family protein [Myxococcota bacterium]|nr:DsbA family protein [Myxococcota bacterium]